MSAEARTRRIFLWAGGIVVLIMLAVIVAPMLFRRGEGYIYGMESYVYGYSMVVMDVTRDVLTAASAPNEDGTAAPVNQFAKMPHYVSPDFKNVVRISLNSLWTTAWLDLDKEPIVLSVPDTQDRYYVFSMMNMWTDVFGSVGKRTTGTGTGAFLIAGPKWQGKAPADVKQTFRSPTRYAWILGQTQANGPGDFAAVNAIQAQYQLTPLDALGQPVRASRQGACQPRREHEGDACRPGRKHGRRHVFQPAGTGDGRESSLSRRHRGA